VPRSPDRGIFIQAIEIMPFSFLAWGLRRLRSTRVTALPADCFEKEFGDNVMGIFDALNTAVGGLQSQSYALQNISGNLANASTVGYKGISTNFEDLLAQTSSPSTQVAGGVQALSEQTLTTAGTISSSTVATNMAITGDGFFSVMKPTSVVDNQPVFHGGTAYNRVGA